MPPVNCREGSIMGGCPVLRCISSRIPNDYRQCLFILKSALLHLLKQLFSFDKRADNQSARKLSKLPGASFYCFVSRDELWHDLTHVTHHQRFTARAPPRKFESKSYYIWIFGGQVMNKINRHDVQIKNFVTTTLVVVVTLYHRPQSIMERGVSI